MHEFVGDAKIVNAALEAKAWTFKVICPKAKAIKFGLKGLARTT